MINYYLEYLCLLVVLAAGDVTEFNIEMKLNLMSQKS